MPLAEIVAEFNWVDIVIVCIILVTMYNSIHKTFIIELFKTLGIVVSIFVSVHYFSSISDFLVRHVPNFNIYFTDPLSFAVLGGGAYFFIFLLRVGFCRLLKIEAIGVLDRWGGIVLGFLRGLLIASLTVVFLNVSFITYLQRLTRKSYLGRQIVYTDINVYEFIFNHLVSKLSPGENLNVAVRDIVEGGLEDVNNEAK